MKKLIFFIVFLFSTTAMGESPEETRTALEKMDWMTEQYPPFNYIDEKDGQLKGITVDILMEMFKKVGVQKTRKDIPILPWARSYNKVLRSPDGTIDKIIAKYLNYRRPLQALIVEPKNG